jgi:hypothetical protein
MRRRVPILISFRLVLLLAVPLLLLLLLHLASFPAPLLLLARVSLR